MDDRRFAAVHCRGKLKERMGAARIRAELLRKGVEREAVEDVLGGLLGKRRGGGCRGGPGCGDGHWRESGSAAVHGGRRPAERRLAGFLARRGYDWERFRGDADADIWQVKTGCPRGGFLDTSFRARVNSDACEDRSMMVLCATLLLTIVAL